MIKDLMKNIVKDVASQYINGEKYFDELDYRIKYNTSIIYALIGEYMGTDTGIVLSGEFGKIVADLIYDNGFPISYILIGGSPRKKEKIYTDCIYGSAKNYIFVDDSFFSGNTYREIKNFVKIKKNQDVVGIKVAYNGSPLANNLIVKSFYRYFDYHDMNGNEL